MNEKPTYKELQQRVEELEQETVKRKQAEEKLNVSEERSRTWLEYSPVCTKIVDLDFNLQYMSSAGVKGLQIEDVTQLYGKPYPFVFYPESFKDVMTSNLEKVKATGEVIAQEASVVDIKGNELWFHSTLVPVNDDKGRIDYIIVVSLDITERKKAEREKEKLESQLRQVHKMEAIGTMAGGIAHDFNNILSVIINASEMTQEKCPEESSSKYYSQMALKAAHRAKELVKQILAFSHHSTQELLPVKPHLIIKEDLKLVRSTIPTTVEIRENIESSYGFINADPTQIHQLVMNLCTNAVHAMDEKGILEIKLDEVTLSSEDLAHKPDLQPGLYSHLSVTDNGCGMDQKMIDNIFVPFFTTKETGVGTGLGLSVIHGIVESHGGMITVESEPGKGTTFHVFFPKVYTEGIQEEKVSKQSPRGNERILFIDDEDMLAEMGGKMLERLGYQVTFTTSSNYALETFKSNPDAFDLVITDQTMPNMSGVELAEELMKTKPDIPIILCTGYSRKVSEDKAKKLGIREFLLKPIDTEKLATTIRKVLDANTFHANS